MLGGRELGYERTPQAAKQAKGWPRLGPTSYPYSQLKNDSVVLSLITIPLASIRGLA